MAAALADSLKNGYKESCKKRMRSARVHKPPSKGPQLGICAGMAGYKSSSSVSGVVTPLRTSEPTLMKRRSVSKDYIDDALESRQLFTSEVHGSAKLLRRGIIAEPVDKVHPMSRLIEAFVDKVDSTYTDRLRLLGLGVGDLEPIVQSTEFADNVLSMQHIGMCFLEDIQEFLVSARMITNFFYRQCISLENQIFQESIVEALTSILFTRKDGIVFEIVKALFKAQHTDAFSELRDQISECSDIKLSDMKVTFLGLETINWEEVEQAEEQKVQKGDEWTEHQCDFFDKQMVALQDETMKRKTSARTKQSPLRLDDEDHLPSFGAAGARKTATFKEERVPQQVPARKLSSDTGVAKSMDRSFTCLLFKPQIEKMRSLGTKIKDPREMMEALREVQAEISQQFLVYQKADKMQSLRNEIASEIRLDESTKATRHFEGLDPLLSKSVHDFGGHADDMGALVGCDVVLSCMIYVLVKANIPEIPVYLSMVGYFTLDQHQEDFEYVSTTLQAATMFIRHEIHKLHDATLHYTYVDGKSCLGSNHIHSPEASAEAYQDVMHRTISNGSTSAQGKHRQGGICLTNPMHESGKIELHVEEPPVT